MDEIQQQRFTDAITEILDKDSVSIKVKSKGDVITEAKVNTDLKLNGGQISQLLYVAGAWDMNVSLKRSGSGLSFSFDLDSKSIYAERARKMAEA